MARSSLIACLTFVIAVGPSVCCCAFAPSAVAAKPAEQRLTDCPHCKPVRSNRSQPKPNRPKCPCRQSASGCKLIPVAMLKPGSWVSNWLLSLESAPGFAFAAVLHAQISQLATPGVASHRPFLDVDDLLDVHHKLRC